MPGVHLAHLHIPAGSTAPFTRAENHDLEYRSGMIQTWNKFCFTGGYIEANVSLPGLSNVLGLWPAIWTMGNLGRAGYGASTDGTVCLPASVAGRVIR